jgi:nucleoside-diphosphate kinase
MQRTLVVIKPDAVQRGLAGRVLSRLEDKGLKIVAMKMLAVDEPLARRMYAEHEGKDFYDALVSFIQSSPVIAAVLAGPEAVAVVRKMLGATFGPEAQPGTIRGDFGLSRRYNLVHGSDSPASAQREIGLFFEPAEMLEYDLHRWGDTLAPGSDI